MSSSSLNFMLGIFVIFFVIIGFSSAETPLAECGLGCARKTTADGTEYGYMANDELLVYSLWKNSHWMYSCEGYGQDCFPDSDPSRSYRSDQRQALQYLDFSLHMDNINQNDWILKYEVAVMEPKYINQFIFPYDVTTFGFPAFSLYMNNQQNLKVMISAGNINIPPRYGNGPYVYFSDSEDKCRSYRPTVANVTNFMNMNLYINVKYGKSAYYFIKKDGFICGYEFEHSHLYQPVYGYGKAPEIKIVNYYTIDYPTINYAPNFFCIDALYGAFVSLYWDHEPSHPPEAHFYEINEINLNNIQMVHKVILTNFDDNVLGRIFANNFDAEYYPVFQSYGGQVFVWFKLPKHDVTFDFWNFKDKAWHGLWKNENDYDVQYQDVQVLNIGDFNMVNPNRILFRAKKSWITKDRPIKADLTRPHRPQPVERQPDEPQNVEPPPSLPQEIQPRPPISATTPPTVPARPSTEPPPPPKTTTLPPRIPSTLLPPTNPTSSPTEPTTVPQPQKPLNATSTSTPSNAPSNSTVSGSSNSSSSNSSSSNGTNTIPLPPTPEQLKGTNNDDGNCPFSKNLPWIFILLIIIDVVEVIILAVLVLLKFRGAKKMREAMAKKKSVKSVKKDKKKKKQKKSTKETTVTKTEEVGKTTVSEAPKTTICQTNYYTINESVKKEAK